MGTPNGAGRSSKIISFRFPKEFIEGITQEARKRDQSLNQYVYAVLGREGMRSHHKKKAV